MTHNKIDYCEILRNNGHRVTSQRLVVLDAICEGESHTTIGEIYARARRLDQEIDRSTIYRALDLFKTLGIVVAAETENGERAYEIAKSEPHHHLICEMCGSEIEIEAGLVREMFDSLESEYSYLIKMDHLVIFGVCPYCKGKLNAPV